MSGDNWFEEERKAVEQTEKAAAVRAAQARLDRAIASPYHNPRETLAAAELFAKVAMGASPVYAPGGYSSSAPSPDYTVPFQKPRGPSAEEGLEAILREVRGASDEEVMKVASKWITKVTNGITEATRQRDL